MSHSMETRNFNLPLFADNDSPTWLGDFNEAMGTMDTAMAKVSNDSNSQVNAIANLTTRVEDCEEKVVEIDNKVQGYDEAIAGKAPVLHADATVKYGAASADLYGHVRLEDAPGNYGAGDGRAATPKALKTVNDAAAAAQEAANAAKKTADAANTTASAASTAANNAANAAAAADRKAQQALDAIGQGGGPSGEWAPVSHADSTTKYGAANASKYGHVKLTDTVTAASASSGIAVSPKAVHDAIENALGGGGANVEHTTSTGSGGTADYCYDPASGLTSIRVYGSSLTFNKGDEYSFGSIPAKMRPKRQYETACVGAASGGAVVLVVSANADGTLKLRSHNVTHYDGVLVNGCITYFAGV